MFRILAFRCGSDDMFGLLQRKFYSVLFVILAVVSVMYIVMYSIIEQELTNDYITKVSDISAKMADDLKIKTDYVQQIAIYFLDNYMNENSEEKEVEEDNFEKELSRIKVYNSDIAGLAIFWDDGNYMLSKSAYLNYLSEMEKSIKNQKEYWMLVENENTDEKYVFFLIDIDDYSNEKNGFMVIDATPLIHNVVSADALFENENIYLLTPLNKLHIKKTSQDENTGLIIRQKIQENLDIVIEFSTDKVNVYLSSLSKIIIIFILLFVGVVFLLLRRMIKNMIKNLNTLKNEIDSLNLE